MSEFVEVQTPDGRTVRFPKGMTRAAMAEALNNLPPAQQAKTGIVDQLGSGTNEGIASFLGFPVDAVSGIINAMQKPEVNLDFNGDLNSMPKATISDREPFIRDAFGGSKTFLNALDPLISDVEPQNVAQRYARRAGHEVGFGIPASMLGARIPGMGPAVMESPTAYLGSSVAGDVGAAIGGQTAQEIAPGNATADIIASLIGGGGASLAASKLTPRLEAAPSLDDVKLKEAETWRRVEGANVSLTPNAEADYLARLNNRMVTDRATNPNLFPRANATIDDIAKNPNRRTLYGIEEDRRLVGRNVAGNADEARVGVALKKEIDDYLRGLDASKVQGADPESAVADTIAARELTARRHRAEEILNKEMRGETRAATTGTGGNEVNATRQNIRTIFDRERDPTLSGKRSGYTPDEMSAMERVVMGTPASNTARAVGRMAPNSGALPMMATGWGGAAGVGGAMATGNPLMAIPAIAGGLGFAGKAAAEGMTKRHIADLVSTVLNGGKAPGLSQSRMAAQRAIVEQLLSQAAQGQQQ